MRRDQGVWWSERASVGLLGGGRDAAGQVVADELEEQATMAVECSRAGKKRRKRRVSKALIAVGLSGDRGGGSGQPPDVNDTERQQQRDRTLARNCWSETGAAAKWAQPGMHNTFFYLF
jgi:hypothetical protein